MDKRKFRFWKKVKSFAESRMEKAWFEGGNCDSSCPNCQLWESKGNVIITRPNDDGSETRCCGNCGHTWQAIFTPVGFVRIPMTKHYRNFDLETVLDSEQYASHVSAMTGEKLHSKSDIAAELTSRDMRIEQLERELDAHKELLYVVDGYYQDYVQKNYGSAEEWLRHIINQYSKIFNGEFDGVSPLVQHNIEQQLIAVRKCKVGSIEWIVQHEQWLEEQLRKQQEKE